MTEVVVIGTDAFFKLLEEAATVAVKKVAEYHQIKKDKWLSYGAAKGIYNRSTRTYQKLRDENKIVFKQDGKKIEYLESSIYEYLIKTSNKHLVK